MHERLQRLRAALAERDLPAMLLTAPTSRRYLSGFTGSAGALLISAEAAFLLTDGRYTVRAAAEAPAFTLREVRAAIKSMPKLVAELAVELNLTRLGFEAAAMTVAEYQQFAQVLDKTVELVATENVVEGLRMVKDAGEIELLRRAAAITDAALAAVLPALTPDMTEREAAWRIEVALHDLGADGPSFPIIVAAGRNSARPHHEPGNDRLGEGQPIIIDMGARLNGYHADLTRTIVLGQPDDTFRAVYAATLEAQQAAIRSLRPGLPWSEADAIARQVIETAGYGRGIAHSLGHGVGLAIHEAPWLRITAPDAPPSPPLQVGMVTSVEPGIYLPEWGGVRIEDLVLITEEGCELLSHAAR
ncbi:MAG: peptidase M24 [Chloroflexus sp.]|uniref:M24 family metallopeptidase n=1 Tax=Chloroflexus sp. TaxID=1904827 RepID=UPI0021DD1D1F|nr:aminopeptidase P family protein [Chloroflexus sp.]GIV90341.1 MAG: peptidase M24 [Chloroflexus sp.]